MPRFMGLVRMEEGQGNPPQALFDAMDAYIGEQAQKGHFLDGGGLFGLEDAINFVVRTGEVTRVDGPYAEAREDRKSTRLNSSHVSESRMPSSA